MRYWLVLHGKKDSIERPDLVGFRHKTDNRKKIMLDEKGHEVPENPKVILFRRGDRILYYWKQDFQIGGIFEVLGRNFEIHEAWTHSRIQFYIKPVVLTKPPFNFKEFVLRKGERLDLFQGLKTVKRSWGSRLQGVYNNPKLLTAHDFHILEEAITGSSLGFALLGVASEWWVGQLTTMIEERKSTWSPWTYQLNAEQIKKIHRQISSLGWAPLYLYQSKKSGGDMSVGFIGHCIEVQSSKTPKLPPNSTLVPKGYRREKYRTWLRLNRIEFAPIQLEYHQFRKWEDSTPIESYELNRPEAPFILVHQISETTLSELDNRQTQRQRLSLKEFQKKQKHYNKIGREGEEFIFMKEKEDLEKAGRLDLVDEVRIISHDDVGAGYDILSFDVEGQPKYIEVKTTTTLSQHFEITTNEWRKAALHGDSYWIYFIRDFHREPFIERIKNPVAWVGKRISLTPSQFTVSLMEQE